MTRAGTSATPRQAEMGTTPCRASCKTFVAVPSRVGEARRYLQGVLVGCLVASDAILCMSELAANACLHSASRLPGGVSTVRALISDDEQVRIEVTDNGGPWSPRAQGDGRLHGLAIVAAVATASGVAGDAESGWLAWATLDWPATNGHPTGAASEKIQLREQPAPGHCRANRHLDGRLLDLPAPAPLQKVPGLLWLGKAPWKCLHLRHPGMRKMQRHSGVPRLDVRLFLNQSYMKYRR
jgi:hypothetical protein